MGTQIIHKIVHSALPAALLISGVMYPAYPQALQGSYDVPWVQVTTLPGKETSPALSPNGKWLAFTADQHGNQDIWIMPAAGGVAKSLTTHPAGDYSPAWSPDGKGVVFVSTRDDAFGDVWWLSLRVTWDDVYPSGKPKKLTGTAGGDDTPTVSPGGKWIAFTSDRDGGDNIWVLHRKKKILEQVTYDGGQNPCWLSNDQLLYVRIDETEHHGSMYVTTIPSTGGQTVKTLNLADFVQGFPAVSPDGVNLAWIRITRDIDGDGDLDWADGSSLWTRAVDSEIAAYPVQKTLDFDFDLYPHWGSDGWIYYSSNRSGGVDIWKVPATGPIPGQATAGEQFLWSHNYLAGALASVREPTREELELARLGYQKVINDYPDSGAWCAKAWYRTSRLYDLQGLRDQQAYVLRRILRFYPEQHEVAALAQVDYQVVLWDESIRTGSDSLFTTASAALVDNLRRFINQTPEQPRATALARLSIANTYFQAHRDQQALAEYMAIREMGEPADIAAEAQMQIAAIFEKFGQGQEVIQSYLKILQDYPNEVEWNRKAIDRIIELTVSDQMRSSVVEGLQQLIQQYPDTPNLTAAAQLGIGEELVLRGEDDLALLELERLEGFRRRVPNQFIRHLSAEAKLLIAGVHLKKKNTRDAIAWYRKVIDEDGELAEGRYRYRATTELLQTLIARGERLEHENDLLRSMAEFSRAISLDSTSIPAWQGLIRVSRWMDRLPEMERELSAALESDPENPLLWYCMGLLMSYKNQGSYHGTLESNRWLEGAIARKSSMSPAYLTLGYNYLALDYLGGKSRRRSFFETVDDAVTTLSRWVTFRRRAPEVDWLERSVNIIRSGIAINHEDDDPRTEARLLINLGNAYYQLGEFGYESAANSYLQGMQYREPFHSVKHEALIRERLGHCLLFSGKYTEASAQLTQARDLYVKIGDAGSEWRVMLRLAELYSFSQEHDLAAEVYSDISDRVDRVGKADSRALWHRNAAVHNLRLKDWKTAERFAKIALSELDSTEVYSRTKIKNYLRFKILGLSIPVMNFGRLGTGTSKAEGFNIQDEWELSQSIRETAATGIKDFPTVRRIISQRLSIAEFTEDIDKQARLNYRLGVVEFRMGNYQVADSLFRKTTEIYLTHPTLVGASYGAMRGLIARGTLLLSWNTVSSQDQQHQHSYAKRVKDWEHHAVDVQDLLKEKGAKTSRDQAVLKNLSSCLLFQNYSSEKPTNYHDAVTRWENTARIESLFLDALSLAKTTDDPVIVVAVHHNLSKFYSEFGEPEKALRHAFTAHQLSVNNEVTEAVWRTEFALGELLFIGDAELTSARDDDTLSTTSNPRQLLENALTTLENQPVYAETYEEEIAHRQSARRCYRVSMDQALDNNDGTELMELAERLQALEWLWAAGAKPFAVKHETQKFIWGEGGGNAPYLQRELQRISSAIRSEQAQEDPDEDLINSWESEHQSLSQEYQELLDKVWDEDPEFGSLFSMRLATVADVQTALDPHEAVLRTIYHRDQVLSWVILPDSVIQVTPSNHSTIFDLLNSQIWTWVLDPAYLHYTNAQLKTVGVPISDGDVTRVADFRSYLIQKIKHEIPGKQGVILSQQWDESALGSLSPVWNVVATESIDGDSALEALSDANLIYIDLPIIARNDQPLSSYFDLGSNPLYFSQLFSQDLTAAVAMIKWNIQDVENQRQGLVVNALLRSFMFAGVPTVVIIPKTDIDLRTVIDFSRLLMDMNAVDAIASLSNSGTDARCKDWILLGARGMKPAQATAYAQDNFRRTILKGNLKLQEGNPKWASRYYLRARRMAVTLGQEAVLSNIDKLLLRAANESGRWQDAVEIQRRLLESAQQAGDHDGVRLGWQNLAVFYTQASDVTNALISWDHVLESAQADADLPSQVNAYLSQSDLYRSSRESEMALQAVTKALRVSKEADNEDMELKCLAQQAKIQYEFDEVESALITLDDAETLLEKVGLSETLIPLALSIYEIKSRILSVIGRYQEALSYTRQALEIAGTDTVQLGYLMQRMADLYWESGRLPEAGRWALRADSLFQRVGDNSYRLLNQNTRSLIALSLGHRDQAVELAGTALALATDQGDSANMATITRNLGLIELQSGKPDRAVLRFKEAQQLDGHLKRTTGLAHDLANLGLAFRATGLLDSALSTLSLAVSVGSPLSDRRPVVKAYLGSALVQYETGNNQDALEMLDRAQEAVRDRPLGAYLWRIWQLRGQIYRETNRRQQAMEAFRRAMVVLEDDPVASADIHPTGIPGQPVDPFDLAMGTAIADDDYESAILTSDRKRRWLQHQPFQLEGYIDSEHGFQSPDWRELQQVIPEGSVLLSYHVTPDTANLFIATSSALVVHGITGNQLTLQQLADELNTAVVKLLSVDEVSHELYRILIEPAEPWLTDSRQVIVLPDGPLWSVPFNALMDNDSRMLIDRFPILTLSTLNHLSRLAAQERPFQNLWAMAYPHSDRVDDDLIFAQREVQRITLEEPIATAFVNGQSREGIFDTTTTNDLVLHFACHGWSDPDDILASGIVMQGDADHDGVWQAREIAGTALDCPLVFLNLCPENDKGNRPTVPILPKAFQVAGCSKVIAPLWKVDDLAAAVTAKLFYRYLREHKPGNGSVSGTLKEIITLRRAQLAVRDKVNAHPAYWAGYIMLY